MSRQPDANAAKWFGLGLHEHAPPQVYAVLSPPIQEPAGILATPTVSPQFALRVFGRDGAFSRINLRSGIFKSPGNHQKCGLYRVRLRALTVGREMMHWLT